MKKLFLFLFAIGVAMGVKASITFPDDNTVKLENFVKSDYDNLSSADKDKLANATKVIISGSVSNEGGCFANGGGMKDKFTHARILDLSDLAISGLNEIKNSVKDICSGEGTVLYTPKALTELDNTFQQISVDTLIIAETVTTIKSNAFRNNSSIKVVYIGKHIKTIESEAFFECTKLTDVIFDKGISDVSIGSLSDNNGVFQNCRAMKHVTIPEGVTTIGNSAFYDCNQLASIHLPSTMEYIGDKAFQLCKDMSQLVIPKNVKRIGKEAFSNSGLKEIFVMQTDTTKIPKIYACNGTSDTNNGTFMATEHLGTNYDLRNIVKDHDTKQDILDYMREPKNNIKTVVLHYPDTPELRAFYDYNPWYKKKQYNNANQEGKKDKFYLSDTYSIIAKDGSMWPANQTPDNAYQNPPVFNDMQRRIEAGKDEYGNYSLSSHGWRQLVVQGAFTSSEVITKEVDDTWYTFCFPYDVTDEQLAVAFNEGFNIAEFNAARILKVDGEDALVFFFRKVAKSEPMDADYGPKYRDDVLAKGCHPYMIHPNKGVNGGEPAGPGQRVEAYIAMTLVTPPEGHVYDTDVNKVTINLMDARNATRSTKGKWTDYRNIERAEVVYDGETDTGYTFTFIGNTTPLEAEAKAIGAGNYFLGCEIDDNRDADGNGTITGWPRFYKETADGYTVSGSTYQRLWTPYTAIIKPSEGVDAWLNANLNTSSTAKKINIDFEEDAIATLETTAINEILNDAERKKLPVKYMPVVYNINGEIVRTDSIELNGLPRGLYIVNGKKYFVK